MGCPAEVFLGEDFTFSFYTHDPETGIVVDADSNPSYWIFEEDTSTQILSGTISKFKRTGQYLKKISCSAANGFEHGKSYTIFVEAIVDSDKGGIAFTFVVRNSRTSGTGAGAIPFTYTLTSSVDSSPITDVDVWVTSDSSGNNVLASGRTDQYGKVTFYLDAGTVYVWRQKSGWNFDNPDTEVVS